MNMADTVPASEFAKNFGRYKMRAQREAVAVSSHGQIAGYFVAAHEYEELLRLKDNRRSFATANLSDEEVKEITSSRMDPRHDHLNKLLDPNYRQHAVLCPKSPAAPPDAEQVPNSKHRKSSTRTDRLIRASLSTHGHRFRHQS